MGLILNFLLGMGPFAKILVPLGLNILEGFIANKNTSAEDRNTLAKVAGILRKQGLENAKSRFEAEAQVQAGADVWDEREKPKPTEGAPSV